MSGKSKIKTRLILTYTIILGVFSLVVLGVFFNLFTKQAHIIHGERMKEQGDMIADIIDKDGSLKKERVDENESRHGRMMRERHGRSNTTDYLSLISNLSKDEIYIVDKEGEVISTSHMMTNNDQKPLSSAGKEVLSKLNQTNQKVFFGKNELEQANQLGYGVPILDEEREVLGAVIVLSDNDNYFLGLGKDYRLLLWSILVALILTILLSIMVAKRFVKPIYQMSEFTDELIQMNYEASLDLKTEDELSELGDKLEILNERLKIAKQEQDNKETNQKLFLSQVSHELRTPVMVIQNSLEALSGDFLDDNEKELYIHQLQQETKQLNRLVNDLLELSRLQITEFSIEHEELNLTDVLQDGIRSYRLILRDKNQTIHFFTESEPIDTLVGDYQRLLQLIKILLDNSIKYSPENSVIELTHYQVDNGIIFEVVNEIEQADLTFDIKHVFEAFNRGSQPVIDGHGLGLTIASQIVSRHEGEIRMERISQAEVKVTVFLPK